MEINDELMMPCAQCCRKHLSAAIACYADETFEPKCFWWRELFARALINLAEADAGYASHRPFAVGLIVRAETNCGDPDTIKELREYRLAVSRGEVPPPRSGDLYPTGTEWYFAHVVEAEREFPDIRTAVERGPFYRVNMSEPERRQAEVNYRLAQLRWLDENVFGNKHEEKGGDEMATKKANPFAKKGAKADPKAAKKAACKGGKCSKGKCK